MSQRLIPSCVLDECLIPRTSTEPNVQLNHINTLTHMLSNVRNPYLNVDSRSSPLARQGSRNIDLNQADTPWASIRHLTNEEREQIDLQARVILTRCSSRIKEMEALEKRESPVLCFGR